MLYLGFMWVFFRYLFIVFFCVGGVACNVISSVMCSLLVLVLLVLAYSLEKGCLWMGRLGIYFFKCCLFVSVSNFFFKDIFESFCVIVKLGCKN